MDRYIISIILWLIGTIIFGFLNYFWLRQEEFHFWDYIKFIFTKKEPIIVNFGYIFCTILIFL